jgi:hypothetical protein
MAAKPEVNLTEKIKYMIKLDSYIIMAKILSKDIRKSMMKKYLDIILK